MVKTREVVLDTNVLLDLMADDAVRAAFVERALATGAAVTIPLVVLDEAVVNNNNTPLVAKARALRELDERLPLSLVDALNEGVVVELAFGGLPSTPVMPKPEASQLIWGLGATDTPGIPVADRVTVAAGHIREWKVAGRARDKAFRSRRPRGSERDLTQSLLECARSLSPETVPTWIVRTTILRAHANVVDRDAAATDAPVSSIPSMVRARLQPQLPEEVLAPMVAARTRMRMLLAWSGLSFLALVANIVTADDLVPFPELEFLKRDRNDFYDANIAAAAAYADVLLTNDSSLRTRCQFLQGRGVVAFKTMDLTQYLGGKCW